MAVGKNKGLAKTGKKGVKKKIIDPFFFENFHATQWQWVKIRVLRKQERKESRRRSLIPSPVRIGTTSKPHPSLKSVMSAKLWLTVQQAPNWPLMVSKAAFMRSHWPIYKTRRTLRDLTRSSSCPVRMFKENCLTQFYGMNLTTDKLRSMVKKWQTLIEAHVDVKTTDGYLLRVFCIGFTQKQQHSTKKHCYAQSQQIRQIRKKMVDIIAREVSSVDLKEVVNKLIPDSMSMDIQQACQGIYPLHDVHIRKVKVQRRPRFDLAKLIELHGEGSGKATTTTTDPNTGEVVERPEGYEPPVQEVV